MEFPVDSSWYPILKEEFEKTYFLELKRRVDAAYANASKLVFPPQHELFRAFELCPWEKLKVVILGQDPYPTKGHAHGLCFSVVSDVKPLPKSLNNIFKERSQDLQLSIPSNGNLSNWAQQGVLLLNSVLTVEQGLPDSHKNWGWEQFTDYVITQIAEQKSNVVFLLWGSKAQFKAQQIDPSKHLILKAAHPSPLAAYRGFFGSGHFSQTNAYLRALGADEIQW